jgi:hypothetical protein
MVKYIQSIAVAVMTTCVMAACAPPANNRESNLVASHSRSGAQPEFSLLTDAGVEQIKGSRRAGFDLRDRTLTNEEVGVPPESTSDVIIGNPGDPDIDLTLVGPIGEVTISAQTIWFTHLDQGRFTEIIFWRSFDTPEGAQQELAQANPRWGILPENVDTWASIATDAGDKKEKWSLGTGVGPTGLIVGMNASTKNDVQVFQYIVDVDPRNYNPVNLESIRTTGIGKRVVE